MTYRIDAGERARVDPAIFLGPIAPYTAEQLLSKAKLKAGQRYREAKASADAVRIREFLHAQGRLKAQVELIAAQPEPNGRIAPVYRVAVGPDVVLQTTGVKEKQVRRALDDLLEGQVFDEDLVLQYSENEGRRLQGKGYFRAKVDYKLDTQPDRVVVTIAVAPGPHYAVEKIVFEGNASAPDATLRKLMVVSPKGVPLIRSGKLTDQDLKGDLDAILGWYQSHGWIAAKVGPADVKDGSRPDRLVVRIPIVEGPRTMVAKRELVGAEHTDTAALEKLLSVRAGEPLNPNALRADAVGDPGLLPGPRVARGGGARRVRPLAGRRRCRSHLPSHGGTAVLLRQDDRPRQYGDEDRPHPPARDLEGGGAVLRGEDSGRAAPALPNGSVSSRGHPPRSRRTPPIASATSRWRFRKRGPSLSCTASATSTCPTPARIATTRSSSAASRTTTSSAACARPGSKGRSPSRDAIGSRSATATPS